MNLVLASKNQGKIREIETSLIIPSLTYRSLNDFPDLPEIIEDGVSFLENALKKAQTISKSLNLPVLADDSGLEVDFLQGAPGIYSARFAGSQATDQENFEKLLALLEGVPEDQRQARFVCVLVLYCPSGDWVQAEGTCEGRITPVPRGLQGFGYDPVFYVPAFQKTMAELPLEVKNRISHRAKALEKIKPSLVSVLKASERPLSH
ncbi:MAG: non-canonical purine NTP pyrophosphatase [Desulfobacca sp.]|nr:non-canonical purine NTP pyrophosphatase [Desulfobacca sp.]